jgi:hypothetical protein
MTSSAVISSKGADQQSVFKTSTIGLETFGYSTITIFDHKLFHIEL